MKMLLLNGHGISMRVHGSKLYIKDGRFSVEDEPLEYVFAPKRMEFDSIIIYGQDGNISIDAIRWLIKHNVQVTILNWNGKLLTTMLPAESVQVKTKFAQYEAYKDEKLRISIARKIIQAKVERSKTLLEWLKTRYPEIEYDFSSEEERLKDATTIAEIIRAEARVAGQYWKQVISIIPDKYEFITRQYADTPFGAGDVVNCMLNYGYALLEAECLKAIHAAGLDPHVGFLHEMKMGKSSLAYDLQEPFRFLIDLAIISIIEKGLMDKKDFIRTENYNLRLRPSGAKKVVNEINIGINKKINYQSMQYSWHYVLMTKTRELAHFLADKKSSIHFNTPKIELNRVDTEELRKKIIDISYSKWKKLGFSKGTLHHMKHNASSDKPFKIYKDVQKRLEEHENLSVV
jgi:CRISPR-associated protein Cas1